MTEHTYEVAGVHCTSCAMNITEALAEVPGVAGADVDVAAGKLRVSGDEFDDQQVAQAVRAAGYELRA